MSLATLTINFVAANNKVDTVTTTATQTLEEVSVSATRAGENTPVTFSNITEEEIKKDNIANNLPMVLQFMPSMVAFTEGGTGVGNTSFRIRGTDDTRINVTLNGMPLNNPESQGLYWVNLPDLSSSLQSIQLQRGIGTSTNGSAAFGATLSLKTAGAKEKAYGEASAAFGSYRTILANVAAGTGILSNGLSFDARYSRVLSDGYIRNGKVIHQNLYLALSHYTDQQLMRLLYIHGEQHTGITWEGVSLKQMEKFGRQYNPAGQYTDDNDQTLYYDNETDNYFSDIVQFIFSGNINNFLSLNAGVSWNHGFGYYENFKEDSKFKKYGLDKQEVDIDGTTTLCDRSDLIRQKKMSNDLYVVNFDLNYRKEAFKFSTGAMANVYDGDHFGNLPWIKYSQNIPENYEWYRNNGFKQEISLFAKAEYTFFKKLSLFGDIQYRHIDYKFRGIDDDLAELNGNYEYSFLNPKIGLFYRLTQSQSLYASSAVGHREPLRADLKDGMKWGATNSIRPEMMIDYELGYRFKNSNGISLSANLYYMDYKDQMVQTGKLNDVGYKLMENVSDSYRTGIELDTKIPLFDNKLRFDFNATISQNKIKNYTHYTDMYDKDYNPLFVDNNPDKGQLQEVKNINSTNISYSPDLVGSAMITYTPFDKFYVSIAGKYVGKQYMDNSSDDAKSIAAYYFSNIYAGYTFQKTKFGTISLQLIANNILNRQYIANGWAATDIVGGEAINYIGYYPQATRNFMGRMTISF